MKRPVFIKYQKSGKATARKELTEKRATAQLVRALRMERGQQTHTAAADLSDRLEVLRTGDLVHRNPVRIHPAQQHQHPLPLWAAGQHVRMWAKVKLRGSMYRTGQLQTLVDDRDTLPRRGQHPNTAAQQRGLSAAGPAKQQAGAVQQRQQLPCGVPDLMRQTDCKRRYLAQAAHTPLLHHRTAAHTNADAALDAQKSGGKLLLHRILRLCGSAQKRLLKLPLCQHTICQRMLRSGQKDRGRLADTQPKLLNSCGIARAKRGPDRLRQNPQQFTVHTHAPFPLQVY